VTLKILNLENVWLNFDWAVINIYLKKVDIVTLDLKKKNVYVHFVTSKG
jgi:hypothetical protein